MKPIKPIMVKSRDKCLSICYSSFDFYVWYNLWRELHTSYHTMGSTDLKHVQEYQLDVMYWN